MSVLDLGLEIVGMPEKTVQELDAQLPALERIAAAIKQAEPFITPLLPILAKMYPDIVAVTPLVQDLIAFAKQKENEK